MSQLMRYDTFRLPKTHSSNAHVQLSSETRGLIFSWTLRLLPYFMYANSQGSGGTAWMRRLTLAFAGRLCDKYHNRVSWLIFLWPINVKYRYYTVMRTRGDALFVKTNFNCTLGYYLGMISSFSFRRVHSLKSIFVLYRIRLIICSYGIGYPS